MRRIDILKPLLILSISSCIAIGATAAAAQHAVETDTTIRTTIVIRPKASDCPPGFTIFHLDSQKRLPPDPKICFVRAAKPAAK